MNTIQETTGQVRRIRRARAFDPDFVYVHSSRTDVQMTWRQFGWTPPSREQQAVTFEQLNRINHGQG